MKALKSTIAGLFLFIISTGVKAQVLQNNKPGKTVLLDNYFNNEWRKDALNNPERWHYTWEDNSNGGYKELGALFNRYGAKTATLYTAPSKANLKKASVYIIVDPDTDKETETPNYINDKDVAAIARWVKKGGVLVLLGNDAGNAEFKNFNNLANKFGIHFNEDCINKVEGTLFEQGAVVTPAGHEIFNDPKKLFIKEFSSLQVNAPATVVLKKGDSNIIAVSKYGKGTVFALGDPWIYNEYINHRRLPAEFENYKAANAWVQWLLKTAE